MNALRRFSDGVSRRGDEGSSVMMSVDMGNRAVAGPDESPKPASSSWSPRLFSSFTSYIGLSLSPKLDDTSDVVSPPGERYVTKERQLEKLKVRFEKEGSAIVPVAGNVCRRCNDDDAVFL
jgi:hypothetical protein